MFLGILFFLLTRPCLPKERDGKAVPVLEYTELPRAFYAPVNFTA
jgi:hypothetical protein